MNILNKHTLLFQFENKHISTFYGSYNTDTLFI